MPEAMSASGDFVYILDGAPEVVYVPAGQSAELVSKYDIETRLAVTSFVLQANFMYQGSYLGISTIKME